jgi:putative aldouronate transport system permease protein
MKTNDFAVQSTKIVKPPSTKKRRIGLEIWKHRTFYLFILPGVVWCIVFNYIPIFGLSVAFKDFNYVDGIMGSPWVGFKYFEQFFGYFQFNELIRNTIVISLLKLVVAFPVPIVLALMLNEVSLPRFKRTVQTISYLPHFVSWVIVVTLMQRLLTPDGGPLNELLSALGGAPGTYYLNEPRYFYFVIIFSHIFKTVGWSSIIYLAAIAGIDPQLYEAAKIDGAGKLRQIFYVTLPGILPIVIILLILETGNLMFAGYDQLYLLRSPGTAGIGTIIDMHVIEQGLKQGKFSYAAAVGLFQSAIGVVLVVTTNFISKRLNGNSLW